MNEVATLGGTSAVPSNPAPSPSYHGLLSKTKAPEGPLQTGFPGQHRSVSLSMGPGGSRLALLQVWSLHQLRQNLDSPTPARPTK